MDEYAAVPEDDVNNVGGKLTLNHFLDRSHPFCECSARMRGSAGGIWPMTARRSQNVSSRGPTQGKHGGSLPTSQSQTVLAIHPARYPKLA
jgi:hypothetical protein